MVDFLVMVDDIWLEIPIVQRTEEIIKHLADQGTGFRVGCFVCKGQDSDFGWKLIFFKHCRDRRRLEHPKHTGCAPGDDKKTEHHCNNCVFHSSLESPGLLGVDFILLVLEQVFHDPGTLSSRFFQKPFDFFFLFCLLVTVFLFSPHPFF